jgi:hypothetical protein
LFPALTDLPDASSLAVAIGWMGLSLLSPISADYSLDLHDDQFVGEGKFKVATFSATRAIAIPRDIVRAFLTVVNKVGPRNCKRNNKARSSEDAKQTR